MLDKKKKNHEQEVTKRPLNIPIYTNSMPVHSPNQLIGNYCRASTAQVTMDVDLVCALTLSSVDIELIKKVLLKCP